MPSIAESGSSNDAAPVDTAPPKMNGVHAESAAVDGAATQVNGDTEASPTTVILTDGVAPPADPVASGKEETKAEEKEEDTEEREIKARKKELDALNAEYKDIAHGAKKELVHLDKRWDKNGDEYYIKQKKAEPRTPGGDWWTKHVLAVIRHFDEGAEPERVEKTTVELYSQHLRDILSKVIKVYPGISFNTEHVTLVLPVECLYHHLSELREAATTLQQGSVEVEHLNILLRFIETQFANTIEQVNNLRPENLVSYDTLWTLFRPGTLIHSKIRGYDRAFRLDSYYTIACGQNAGFYITAAYTDCDGENFGTRGERLKIPPFAGSTGIATLPTAPLDMRVRKDEIRAALMRRGQRWQKMRGQCHGEYVGVAIEEGDTDRKFSIRGRVMVDGVLYNRMRADHAWEASEDEEAIEAAFWAEDSMSAEDFAVFKAAQAAEKAARSLSDEELLLATNIIRGFSFSEKRWFLFFIDGFSEIKWNEASFDRLVLPEAAKTLVRALVTAHLRAEDDKFDDIIKGKGRGLVTVLHGSPGVGKTLTAECIAEYSHRPLYVISSGDLGTSASELEEELTRSLDLAHTWKAVLLIDEADVFLEKRSLTDVHRNALVSVFLRLLEYYEGILFLTTNRVNTFDPAFQSRIHMALKYENLEARARQRLWKDFLSGLKGGTDMSDEDYAVLAQYDVNGRQIKNAVKTAESLASFMGARLGLTHLETVLRTQADFAEAFKGNDFNSIS
ncbi:P-loop containing nucleoside triphosphate hydrolase protein [Mycena belliarum]|uniref:P-loop containing nucleoside triphosphate hydrolase protein n=1 Tax=Mycena belliarum TaxID=1033014 RepID=A0AAD6XT26_9AGAR|nr:P-loop containing nucleoside triphosphate hydrolase protein [Mycena belliae]